MAEERERHEQFKRRRVNERVKELEARRRRHRGTADREVVKQIRQQAQEEIDRQYESIYRPSRGIIISHWTRRFMYVFLILTCAGFDVVLTTSQVGALLFGIGGTPAVLVPLFSHLQLLAGVLFVSAVALCGMLIEDHMGKLPPAVRLQPEISEFARRMRLVLAVGMLALNVAVVTALAIEFVTLRARPNHPFDPALYPLYAVLGGEAVLVATGLFLAFPAFTELVSALAVLVGGGIAAFICDLVGFVLLAPNALFRGRAPAGRLREKP